MKNKTPPTPPWTGYCIDLRAINPKCPPGWSVMPSGIVVRDAMYDALRPCAGGGKIPPHGDLRWVIWWGVDTDWNEQHFHPKWGAFRNNLNEMPLRSPPTIYTGKEVVRVWWQDPLGEVSGMTIKSRPWDYHTPRDADRWMGDRFVPRVEGPSGTYGMENA